MNVVNTSHRRSVIDRPPRMLREGVPEGAVLDAQSGRQRMRDLWRQKDLGVFADGSIDETTQGILNER